MNSLTDRAARAALTFVAEPADPVVNALLAVSSPLDVLDMLTTGRIVNLGDEEMANTARRTFDCCRERLGEVPGPDQLDAWERAGIRIVCPGDPEWPGQVEDLGHEKPYALWVRGSADLRFSCLRSISIVGSRAATAYGSYVAGDMASAVAARGWTVVSGAAYGVDGAAQRAAVGADGATIAVLAGGVDMPYPAGHADLIDAIAEAGAVVSEWPPGRHVTRLRFLLRNRIIAALSAGTLIIEAGERSGTMNAARRARDLGRKLMAVPGPVTSAQSHGCHTIIRDWGGTLVTGPHDVLEAMAPPPPNDGGQRGPTRSRGQLDVASTAVLDALPHRGTLNTAVIAERSGLPADEVLRLLGELAARGFAERCEHGWRRRHP